MGYGRLEVLIADLFCQTNHNAACHALAIILEAHGGFISVLNLLILSAIILLSGI